MIDRDAASRKVAHLRQAFDEAFAAPALAAAEARADLIAIRVGGEPCALKVNELSGVLAGRRLVFLPSRKPGVLGIVGVRGALLPVYSLAILLGYGADDGATRWLALSSGPEPIGLAFQAWEGTLRLRRDELHVVDRAEARRHVRELALAGGTVRPVVSVDSVVLSLKQDAGAAGPTKEP